MIEPRLPARQRGFALMLALWASVIVLGLAAALDAWVGARVEQATLIRQRVQDELDAYSTRATLLYLLGTQRLTRAGLTTGEPAEAAPGTLGADDGTVADFEPAGGEIALDGRAYAGIGRVRFALQDTAGLVPLNDPGARGRLEALLEDFEADPVASAALLDALADYRDPNTDRRANGAEKDEYLAAGLPPPSNRDLRAVPELLRVFGWADWLAAHPSFRPNDWLSASRQPVFNPNAVPESLLAGLPGADEATARQIALARAERPFENAADFEARADIALGIDEDALRFTPNQGALQLRLWTEGTAHAEVLAIELTADGEHSPWQFDSLYHVSRSSQDPVHEAPGQYFSPRAAAAR